VDLRPDSAGGPPPGVSWTWHDPALVEAALGRAGFGAVEVTGTGRFFLTATVAELAGQFAAIRIVKEMWVACLHLIAHGLHGNRKISAILRSHRDS
jgi:hypothetical protein